MPALAFAFAEEEIPLEPDGLAQHKNRFNCVNPHIEDSDSVSDTLGEALKNPLLFPSAIIVSNTE